MLKLKQIKFKSSIQW